MKKLLIACAIAAGMGVVATGAQAAPGHGGGGWSGGHGSGWSGGHGSWHGGGHFNGGHGFNHFRGRGFVGFGSVFLGWPYWWGPAYYGYPSYTYYDAPAYYDYPTEVYVEPSNPQAPAAAPPSQFYCPDTGYYPAVQTCPRGWLRVVPGSPPPT